MSLALGVRGTEAQEGRTPEGQGAPPNVETLILAVQTSDLILVSRSSHPGMQRDDRRQWGGEGWGGSRAIGSV